MNGYPASLNLNGPTSCARDGDGPLHLPSSSLVVLSPSAFPPLTPHIEVIGASHATASTPLVPIAMDVVFCDGGGIVLAVGIGGDFSMLVVSMPATRN